MTHRTRWLFSFVAWRCPEFTLRFVRMFLSGQSDPFMSSERTAAWKTLAAQNPNIRIIWIPDAGHLAWIDRRSHSVP